MTIKLFPLRFFSIVFLLLLPQLLYAQGHQEKMADQADKGVVAQKKGDVKENGKIIQQQKSDRLKKGKGNAVFEFKVDPQKRTIKAATKKIIPKREKRAALDNAKAFSSLVSASCKIENVCEPLDTAKTLVPCSENDEHGCAEGSELWLSNIHSTFKSGNILEINATYKNITGNESFRQPFCFTVNEQTTCNKIKLITLPNSEDLVNAFGNDEVLSPGETTTILTYTVKHKGRSFSFFVDAHAIVEEIPTPSPTPSEEPTPTPTPTPVPVPHLL